MTSRAYIRWTRRLAVINQSVQPQSHITSTAQQGLHRRALLDPRVRQMACPIRMCLVTRQRLPSALLLRFQIAQERVRAPDLPDAPSILGSGRLWLTLDSTLGTVKAGKAFYCLGHHTHVDQLVRRAPGLIQQPVYARPDILTHVYRVLALQMLAGLHWLGQWRRALSAACPAAEPRILDTIYFGKVVLNSSQAGRLDHISTLIDNETDQPCLPPTLDHSLRQVSSLEERILEVEASDHPAVAPLPAPSGAQAYSSLTDLACALVVPWKAVQNLYCSSATTDRPDPQSELDTSFAPAMAFLPYYQQLPPFNRIKSSAIDLGSLSIPSATTAKASRAVP
ncbi:hypothetical protein IWQ60_012098, partial [Tieghemiomyces parasiticus]